MRVGTLNVGTMTDKGSRLDAMMASKAKTIGGGFYHGIEEKLSNLEGKD